MNCKMALQKRLASAALAFCIILTLGRQVNSAPTLDSGEVEAVVQSVAKDLSGLAMAKAAALGFAGGVTANTAFKGAEELRKILEETGSEALESAVEVQDYVANIDFVEALNNTEDALVEKKISVIRKVFEAKRQLIKNLRDILTQHSATVAAFYSTTLDGINEAIASTQQGILAAKESASNVVAQLTVENAQAQLDNVQLAVSGAVEDTVTSVEETGSALLNSLVKAKAELQEAAENFDSKLVASQAKDKVGQAVDVTISQAGKLAEQAGIYEAIDDLVHSLSGVPSKINGLLKEAKNEIQVELTLAPAGGGVAAARENDEAVQEAEDPSVESFRSMSSDPAEE